MEIDQLRTFLAVLEHGGFSRAAQALGVGQSTVSFHIKALETSVGSRLLDRRGGRLRTTSSGAQLRRYALRIVSLSEEALLRLRTDEEGIRGRIVIAASTIPAEHLLPPLLAVFRKRYPGVALSVEVSDSGRALARLLAHECDLALVGVRSRDKRVLSTAFAEDAIILVGPVPNPFAPGNRLSVRDLPRVPLILREEGSGTRDVASSLLARSDAADPRDPAPIQVGSTEAVKRCVLAGLGLALISQRAVADEVAAGRLTQVALPGTPIRRSFFVARLRHVTPPPALRNLLEVLIPGNR